MISDPVPLLHRIGSTSERCQRPAIPKLALNLYLPGAPPGTPATLVAISCMPSGDMGRHQGRQRQSGETTTKHPHPTWRPTLKARRQHEGGCKDSQVEAGHGPADTPLAVPRLPNGRMPQSPPWLPHPFDCVRMASDAITVELRTHA
jgi:hypothetical protein